MKRDFLSERDELMLRVLLDKPLCFVEILVAMKLKSNTWHKHREAMRVHNLMARDLVEQTQGFPHVMFGITALGTERLKTLPCKTSNSK